MNKGVVVDIVVGIVVAVNVNAVVVRGGRIGP